VLGTIGEVFGRNVRRLRKQRGYTLERLSELADISAAALKNYEGTKKEDYRDGRVPEAPIVSRLAKALGVDEVALFQAEEPKPTPEVALDALAEEINRLRVELAEARAGSRAPAAPVIPPEVAAALARLPAQSPRWIAVRAALGLEPALAADSASPAPPKAKK
jgi:transcriptional regulator with XRE-family HTH domain